MAAVVVCLILIAGWAAMIGVVVLGTRRQWAEWNGRRVFWLVPLAGNRQRPQMLETGVEYVANYALDIRRNYPDSWLTGFAFERFAEIPLDDIVGGRDFRAFGTAPEVARALVEDAAIRKQLQQFNDWHEALVIDAEGVRVRRVLTRGWPAWPRAHIRRLVAEAVPLAVAAYDRITALDLR